MPARSKYVAVRPFSVGGRHFEAGDVVEPSLALEVALSHGDTFVVADTARTRKSVSTAKADESTTEE